MNAFDEKRKDLPGQQQLGNTTQKVITLRIPWNKREALKILAHECRVSLNTLVEAAVQHFLNHAKPVEPKGYRGLIIEGAQVGYVSTPNTPRGEPLRYVHPVGSLGGSAGAAAGRSRSRVETCDGCQYRGGRCECGEACGADGVGALGEAS